MPFNEIQQFGGQVQNPLETLQKIMMIKYQAEQEGKVQEQAFTEEMKRLRLQQDAQKTMAELNFENQKKLSKFNIEQNLLGQQKGREQETADWQGQGQQVMEKIRSFFSDKGERRPMPGQQWPLSEAGQVLIPAMEAAYASGQQPDINMITQGMKREPTALDLLKLQEKQQAESGKNQRLKDTLEYKKRALKLSMDLRRDIWESKKQLAITLEGMHKGGPGDEKGKMAAITMIERAAKNISDDDSVTEDDYIEAIEYLSAIYPETFGEFREVIDEIEPDFWSNITFGLLGETGKKTLKPKILPSQKATVDSVTSKHGF